MKANIMNHPLAKGEISLLNFLKHKLKPSIQIKKGLIINDTPYGFAEIIEEDFTGLMFLVKFEKPVYKNMYTLFLSKNFINKIIYHGKASINEK